MPTSRMKRMARRTAAASAMLTGFASISVAQGARTGPPVTTQGELKANPKAAKGQLKATSKRADAKKRNEARALDKEHDKAEHAAWKLAKAERKAALRGITLTAAQRSAADAVERRYIVERRALLKEQEAAWLAGKADPTMVSRIEALRMRERADLRAGLTRLEQEHFDRNVAELASIKP